MTDTNQPQQDELRTKIAFTLQQAGVYPYPEFVGPLEKLFNELLASRPCTHEPVSDDLDEFVTKLWQIFKNDSLASSGAGWPSRNTLTALKAATNTLRAHDIAAAELRGRIAELEIWNPPSSGSKLRELRRQLAQLEGKQNGGSDA